MGFWHTGYIEFHQPTGLGDESHFHPARIRYVCEQCANDFAELEDLRRHRFEQHPMRQPVLLIRGRAVGEEALLVVTALRTEEVSIEDATRCKLNGHSVSPAALGELLARMRHEFVELEIANAGVTVQRRLDFQIADDVDLTGVDAAFERMASGQVLNLEAVTRFTNECRKFPSAKPYWDGISHYLYGVMAKERSPDSGLRQDQYGERYLRAAEALAGFDRPLALSIRALVAFHFNHFAEAAALASEGALRHTASAFAALLQGLPWQLNDDSSPDARGAVEDLLTDQETLQIVDDAGRGLQHLRAHAAELLVQAKRMSTGYDRMKRQLLAGEALAAKEDPISHAEARKLARELVGQAGTGPWAEALLKRMRA